MTASGRNTGVKNGRPWMWSQCRWVSSTVARYGLTSRFARSSPWKRSVTMSPYSRTPVPRSKIIGW